MNSVNYLTSIGSSGTTSQPLSTSRSAAENPSAQNDVDADAPSHSEKSIQSSEQETAWAGNGVLTRDHEGDAREVAGEEDMIDEKTPLLNLANTEDALLAQNRGALPLYARIGNAVAGTFRFILSAVLVPGRYLIACFYDENGHFSAALPVYRIAQKLSRRQRKGGAQAQRDSPESEEKRSKQNRDKSSRSATAGSSASVKAEDDSPARHTRSKSSTSEDADSESSAPKRSIRIKVLDEDPLRQRKHRRDPKPSDSIPAPQTQNTTLTVTNIKSPMSTSSSLGLTRYPRAPAPPRPLIPRRHPSYTNLSSSIPSINTNQKTLIIDLDETLIHSMAKGGRMSTGHMVEVKLQHPVGVGGSIIGPQVPILYYVHKRPHCDEFLRKVSKWYNLIIFTASVQEYADPVVDWLELERKYFSARYYRQHCTYRNGAYIKDLSQVEPDLSRVMILDNSPMSYIFHEDNAIPIEGWISDPTDNDLLHLIPLLEGLQHSTDVRALLALRLGESTSH